MKDFIYENESLSEDICNRIIELFETKIQDDYTEYHVNPIGELVIHLHSLTDSNWSDIKEILIDEVTKHINIYCSHLDNDIFFFNSIHTTKSMNEIFIQKYNKNEECTNYNNDYYINLFNKKAKLFTFIFYLNTINEGGETDFFGYHKIKPEKGKIVLFPSEWFFPYCQLHSLTDYKYILTGAIYIDV
jgi:hypothetical protein